MMEDELVKIWQSSPNQERAKFERSRLMIEVQSSVDHFHRKIKYRDLREQAGALVVIPIFAYFAYSIPFMLTRIASVLIIFWGIFVIIRLRNAKKHRPGSFSETSTWTIYTRPGSISSSKSSCWIAYSTGTFYLR